MCKKICSPLVILFLSTVFTTDVLGQSPGNVASNLELWLKADAGALNTGTGISATNGEQVNTWEDQSGARTNDATDVLLAPPTFRDNSSDYINYNVVVDFDGTNDGLDFGNDYIFSSGSGTEDGMTWFAIVEPDSASTAKNNQFIFDFGLYANNSYSLQYGYSHFAIVSGTSIGGVFSGRVAHSRLEKTTLNRLTIDFGSVHSLHFDGANTPINSASITTSALSATQINENPTHIVANGPFTIGHQSKSVLVANNGGRRLDGSIAELIGYNKVLTSTEIKRVESYLAIKYGITLDNTGGGINGDYEATGGSTIWDASDGSGYHNQVIGIGRDDNSDLVQKQSHSMNDTTRIYMSTLTASNAANVGTFTLDESYVVCGNDLGLMCATATSIIEIPSGESIYSRLEREWKVTKTGYSQNFNMDLTVSDCAAPGDIDPAHLRLLVDDDGDFTDAAVYASSGGLTISYSGGVITVTGISNTHIPDNSTRYVTIASIDGGTPLPIELLKFEAKPINDRYVALEWQTASEINNDYFEIERSKDAINWEVISEKIDGAGNSSSLLSYEDFDYYPYKGTSYYRLKQTDFDGAFSYSAIRSVNFKGELDVTIYPNPFSDYTIINFGAELKGEKHLVLFNSLGQKVYQSENLVGTEYKLNKEKLAQGVYLLSLVDISGSVFVAKLIVY